MEGPLLIMSFSNSRFFWQRVFIPRLISNGQLSPRSSREDDKQRSDCPFPPHPSTRRNTWSSQNTDSECIRDACWVWKGTKSSRTQGVERGSQEKCFGSTHLHSCQMAKLGRPLLLPAVGLRAVLSLAPETKYALSLTQSNIWGYFQVFQRRSEKR